MHVLLFFMSHELIYFYGHNDLEKTIKLYKEILIRGGVTKKNGKIWDKFPIRLDPHPSDNSDIFEFQTFLIKVIL